MNNDCYKVKIGVVKVRHSNVDIFREQKLGSRNILVKLVKEYASGKLYRDTQNSWKLIIRESTVLKYKRELLGTILGPRRSQIALKWKYELNII